MATAERVILISLSIPGGIFFTDKVSLRALIVKAAADDLFYLSVVNIDAGAELSQSGDLFV